MLHIDIFNTDCTCFLKILLCKVQNSDCHLVWQATRAERRRTVIPKIILPLQESPWIGENSRSVHSDFAVSLETKQECRVLGDTRWQQTYQRGVIKGTLSLSARIKTCTGLTNQLVSLDRRLHAMTHNHHFSYEMQVKKTYWIKTMTQVTWRHPVAFFQTNVLDFNLWPSCGSKIHVLKLKLRKGRVLPRQLVLWPNASGKIWGPVRIICKCSSSLVSVEKHHYFFY